MKFAMAILGQKYLKWVKCYVLFPSLIFIFLLINVNKF